MFRRPLDILGFALILAVSFLATWPVDHYIRTGYALLIDLPICLAIGYFGAGLWFRLVPRG